MHTSTDSSASNSRRRWWPLRSNSGGPPPTTSRRGTIIVREQQQAGTPVNNLKQVKRPAIVLQAEESVQRLRPIIEEFGLIPRLAESEEATNAKPDLERLLLRVKVVEEHITAKSSEEKEVQCRKKLKQGLSHIDNLYRWWKEPQVRSHPSAVALPDIIKKVEQALFIYELSHIQSSFHDDLPVHISSEDRAALQRLTPVQDGRFDKAHCRTRCLAGTREGLLNSLHSWANGSNEYPICLLHGEAGSGKSTVSQSFAEQLFVDSRLGASFFCSRNSQQRSDPRRVFPTIAYQLATSRDPASIIYRGVLLRTIADCADLGSLSQREQFQKFIVGPLKESNMKSVVIVDGLDECQDEYFADFFMSLLSDNIAEIPSLKLFFATRPTPDAPDLPVLLFDAVPDEKDIRMFLCSELTDTAFSHQPEGRKLIDSLPRLTTLAMKDRPSFMFAATTIRTIQCGPTPPLAQLEMVLALEGSGDTHTRTLLDTLYLSILRTASDKKDTHFISALQSLLGLLVVACQPLSLSTMSALLPGNNSSGPNCILDSLRSVITESKDTTPTFSFYHISFSDFLTDQERVSDSGFYIDTNYYHFLATKSCLELMKQSLKKNICGLPTYTMNIDIGARDECITGAMRYCCFYWPIHLLSDAQGDLGTHSSVIQPLLFDFLTKRQLLWFEVLGILQLSWCAARSLGTVQTWLTNMEPKDYQTMLEYVAEGRQFATSYLEVMEQSVLHLYHSALPLASKSRLAKPYESDMNNEVKVVLGGTLSREKPLKTIEASDWVNALEYSHDGTRLAVGGDFFCRLLRCGGGEDDKDLDLDCSRIVRCVSFSSTDKILAIAYSDVVAIWNSETGKQICELPQSATRTLSFHPSDPNLLLSADSNESISLWAIDARETRYNERITGTDGRVCWYHNSTLPEDIPVPNDSLTVIERSMFLVGCESGNIQLRKMKSTGPAEPPKIFSPHVSQADDSSDPYDATITSVASSRNAALVASGFSNGNLIVYDAETTEMLLRVSAPESILSLCFSPSVEDNLLALASGETVSLYYVDLQATARKLHTVINSRHTGDVNSVVFSPNGQHIASGADDSVIKIWNLDEHHCCPIFSINISNDGTLIATGAVDKTVRVWNVAAGARLQVLRGHEATVYDVIFLQDNSHVVSIDVEEKLIIWKREETKYVRGSPQTFSYSWGSSILGYTHNEKGFFCCQGDFDYTRWIECWTLRGDRMELVAQGLLGALEYDGECVVDIGHKDIPDSNDIILVLECRSGNRFLATWRDATGTNPEPTKSPEELNFTPDTEHNEWIKLKHNFKQRCTLSPDDQWVLDKAGKKILWVPPAYRGFGFWDGRKLVLGARTGLLTVFDFANISTSVVDLEWDEPREESEVQ